MGLEGKIKSDKKNGLDKDGLPEREGVYLVNSPMSDEPEEIDVYEHPVKGLCCFSHDLGLEGGNTHYQYDDHVSVQMIHSHKFIKRVRDLD